MTAVNVVVEGDSDTGTARAVIQAAGHDVLKVVVKNGKSRLDPALVKYNRAARFTPWVVFRDSDTQCPVGLRARLLAGIDVTPGFLLRVVHPMTEAWLLADSERFASYFRVAETRIPSDPEDLQNPKTRVLTLCRSARDRRIREDVVRDDGRPGPLYAVRLNEFATGYWRPEIAGGRSPSLRRALAALDRL